VGGFCCSGEARSKDRSVPQLLQGSGFVMSFVVDTGIGVFVQELPKAAIF
jgi:hypothetical protein